MNYRFLHTLKKGQIKLLYDEKKIKKNLMHIFLNINRCSHIFQHAIYLNYFLMISCQGLEK
jgi:hypothetical protein